MKTEFNRTGITKLTDDELMLFDVMFDCSCPVKALKKSKFSDFFNTKSHNLNDKKLNETLKKLNDEKLIRFMKNQDSLEKISNRQFRKIKSTFVELTSKGGKLWEKEREPIWGKYLINLCDYVDDNKRVITITSPSLKTIEDYFEVAEKLNLNDLTEIYKTTFKIENRKYIEGLRWKRFPEIHITEIIGWQSDEDSEKWHEVDWNYYNRNLNWWSNVHELNSLKKKNIS